MPHPTLRRLAMAGACLLLVLVPVHAQTSTIDRLWTALSSGPGPGSINALDAVIKNSEVMPTQFLYTASGVAMREKRLEDAAFLFYAGRVRANFDRTMFPPTGTGGDSPMLALSALQQSAGSVVNPAIVLEPKTYAKALARFKEWTPRVPTNYTPGWSFASKSTEEQSLAAIAAGRAQLFKSLNDTCTLLQDETYFSAYCIGQAYNTKAGAERPSKEAFDAAIDTLKRIETEKGIPGIGTQLKK